MKRDGRGEKRNEWRTKRNNGTENVDIRVKSKERGNKRRMDRVKERDNEHEGAEEGETEQYMRKKGKE